MLCRMARSRGQGSYVDNLLTPQELKRVAYNIGEGTKIDGTLAQESVLDSVFCVK
jgi:hypothetical protein